VLIRGVEFGGFSKGIGQHGRRTAEYREPNCYETGHEKILRVFSRFEPVFTDKKQHIFEGFLCPSRHFSKDVATLRRGKRNL
jgi:hypothetical protein